MIRIIEPGDIEKVLEIYRPYIEDTVITFEYEVPSVLEFTNRVLSVVKEYPWLVCEVDGEVVGYAYASIYAMRTAFSWDCELSVYMDQEYRGRGMGRLLYEKVIKLVREQGYFNAYALIALPNEKSEKLHQSLSFTYEGRLKNIGYKLGNWVDLGYYVKRLQQEQVPSLPPISFEELDKNVINKIIEEE